MARGGVTVWVRCPKSTKAWLLHARSQAGRPGRRTATCPSCGQGLSLVETATGLELVPPRLIPSMLVHQLGQEAPKVPLVTR